MVEVRPIPDWPGYYAGSDGNIYSTRGRWRHPADPPRVLRPGSQKNGYLLVVLTRDGKATPQRVHVLVCSAFHGPRPPGKEVSHEDDVKTNNVPSNLSWKTKEQNHAQRRINGIDDRGAHNSRAVLNHEQVAEVRRLLARGEKHQDIADLYGVGRTTITRINTGERYPVAGGDSEDDRE